MAVVVDANLLLVLATRDPRRPQVAARFEAWSHEGESLHAPELMPYEVANAVGRPAGDGHPHRLWMLDGSLARNAASHGLPVQLLGSER